MLIQLSGNLLYLWRGQFVPMYSEKVAHLKMLCAPMVFNKQLVTQTGNVRLILLLIRIVHLEVLKLKRLNFLSRAILPLKRQALREAALSTGLRYRFAMS